MSAIFEWSRELCPIDVSCRLVRMIKASNKITLEDIFNECINLAIKCDSGMNEHRCQSNFY
ncbi:unnamed protein product [Hymenolepis diminuta]|uniref:Uncharacterized protein n=1 Tax=Hymenolepis diminuta TaxID=6216 RepID=A0A564YHK1_HYMDI|nr:unnamed protein product [Hymenolepis diminuta]